MLNFYSGSSKLVNPKKAVAEALKDVMEQATDKITLIILNITSGYNHSQILEAISDTIPDVKIIGTTGCGVVGNNFVNETLRALSLSAISGNEFSIAKIDGLHSDNSYDLAQSCAQDLKTKNANINMLMVFAPGIISNGEAIIHGFTDVFTDRVPLLGGLGGFNGNDSSKMFTFFNKEILTNGIVAIGFSDETLSSAQASHHGYLSDKHTFKITKIDGPNIVELDNVPAWNKVMNTYNLPLNTTPLEALSLFALGIELDDELSKEYDNRYTLTAPLVIGENGSMLVQTDIAVGKTITLCPRDEDYLMKGVDGLNKRIVNQYGNKEPVAVFQTDCVARGRLSNGVIEKEEIIHNLQNGIISNKDIPWLGMYAFGEFAQLNHKNHYHNYTASISVLLR